jgi:hypothetical protein
MEAPLFFTSTDWALQAIMPHKLMAIVNNVSCFHLKLSSAYLKLPGIKALFNLAKIILEIKKACN